LNGQSKCSYYENRREKNKIMVENMHEIDVHCVEEAEKEEEKDDESRRYVCSKSSYSPYLFVIYVMSN